MYCEPAPIHTPCLDGAVRTLRRRLWPTGSKPVRGTGQLEILASREECPLGQGKISIAPERRLLNSADR